MTLTVEDGTGLANADALISLAYATSYHDARGNAAWADESSDELKEEAIRRASRYISDAFDWAGYPTRNRDQALAWPRAYVIDRNGYSVASDEVPDEIQRATAEAALAELSTPGTFTPTYTPNQEKKSARVGPIAVEYANVGRGAHASRPMLTAISDIVSGLFARGNSEVSGSALRG